MKNKKLFWIYALSSSVYFTQGAEGLPSQGLFYHFKETLGLSPENIMIISSITTFAWLVKPFIGYVIDNFLSKRAWIFLALFFDIILTLVLGFNALSVALIVGLLILTSANSAFRDVAVDGIMCVEGKLYNATGRIQSVQWISISIASLLTGIAGGFVAENWGYKAGFLLLVPVYLLVGVSAYFFQEDKAIDGKKRSGLISDLKQLFTNKKLLIIAVFIFLYKYSPSFGTPLFFIQRDVFKWGKIWIGALSSIGTIFTIIGALLYFKFSRKIRFKKWLFYSVFLGALTSLSYLYYTPATAVVYDVLYSLLGMFIFLMIMDFMARNTVKGLEATSFALLASFSNLSLVASNLSGAFLLPKIGLNGVIILSALTSFLCLFLIDKIEDTPQD
ncbi:MAG: folate/biopterin family MFS transporter [Candidatus Omnitrophica bacterium]|nr:folate/biopterin family MFS transporter [Candidatus Omnitrophota bacterium]